MKQSCAESARAALVEFALGGIVAASKGRTVKLQLVVVVLLIEGEDAKDVRADLL